VDARFDPSVDDDGLIKPENVTAVAQDFFQKENFRATSLRAGSLNWLDVVEDFT
jgi:hypothetical protein